MTAAVTVTATRADGTELTIEGLKSLRIAADLETPAVSMSAVFAPPAFMGREEAWRGISVRCGAVTLFEGAPDMKRDALSAKGAVTEIEARSAAAALLDNQARPGQMVNANLATVFKHFAAPYGLRLIAPPRGGTLPLYTVYAGTSEWEAFCGFVRRVYRVTPYVSGMNVVVGRPPCGAAPLVISNTGDRARFTALVREQIPYRVVSSVHLRGPDGVYGMAMHNAAAQGRGIRRKRYVTPPSEFVQDARFDAALMINRSLFLAERITAELPGIRGAELGAEAAVEDAALRAGGLLVAKREHIFGDSGIFTRLTLQKAMYYG